MGAGTTRLSFLQRLQGRSNELSWAEFHDRYGELLYRFARGRGASHSDAEETVQEVEISLFKAIDKFQYDPRKGRFRGYLRTAVVRALARLAQQRANREVPLDPQTLDGITRQDADDDAQWEREWRLHRLRWAFRSIANEFEPATLEAFRLCALAHRPVDETAKQLGISKASVYQAKSRVLKRLRERIDALGPDDDAWG
ncbi:MAG: RNA polymerase sigma factor [Phycisphaerae bacterium]